jgi:hypothetical protein
MLTGMTDEAWAMEALLRYRVPRDFHTQFDQWAINVTSLLFYTRYRGTPPMIERTPFLLDLINLSRWEVLSK